jgi:copper chaperone CopZ
MSKYMNDIELVVGGMTCRRCVREVTSRLRDVPGVERVTANPARPPGPPVRVDKPRRRAGRIRRDHLPARRPARSLTTRRARLDARTSTGTRQRQASPAHDAADDNPPRWWSQDPEG